MAQKSYKSVKYLQAFIVEDHHEVVPYIHTYIGSKQLPFEGLTMIHFDSHPDLLLPIDMPADTVFNKYSLYDILSIENWILPLVYAGHVSTIYWLKPPWCKQIAEKTLQFFVGKCVKTGVIRTTCKENYFVTEALYAPKDQLENAKKVSLTVICVKPQHWVDADTNSALTSNFNTCDQSVKSGELHAGKYSLTCPVHTKTDCPQNAVDLEVNCPKNVVHSDADSPQNAVHTKINCPQNAVHPKINISQNALHSETNCPQKVVHPDTNSSQISAHNPVYTEIDGLQKTVHTGTKCPENAVHTGTDFPQKTVHLDPNCQQTTAQLTMASNDMENTSLNKTKLKNEQLNSCFFQDNATNCSPQKKVKQDVKSNRNTLRKKCVLSPSICEEFVKISEQLQGKQYILDIDLDFYSTRNPFKGLYSAEQLQLLSELYKFDKPDDLSDDALQRCVERREKQLATLKEAISVLSEDIQATVTTLDDKRMSLVRNLVHDVLSTDNDADLDLLHNAGCTMDDTELPHHVSSEEDIDQLMNATEEILKLVPQPKLVTVARSSNDDYCPAHQVEFIQQSVIQILERAYPSLVVMPTYSQDSEFE